MKLSIIIPAYNEADTIQTVLKKLLAQKVVREIVVIDDASTDQTATKVNTIKNKKIRLIKHPKNMGKGKAIQTGLKNITGDYVLIQDADLEYDPADIDALIQPVKQGKTTVVYGSRFMGPHTNMYYWHYLGNKFLNFLVNILYNSILSDMETCYKLIPADLMRQLNLKSNDFRIEPEITCKLLKRRVTIMEVPISYVGRRFEEGKKITWHDGYLALITILKIRLTP